MDQQGIENHIGVHFKLIKDLQGKIADLTRRIAELEKVREGGDDALAGRLDKQVATLESHNNSLGMALEVAEIHADRLNALEQRASNAVHERTRAEAERDKLAEWVLALEWVHTCEGCGLPEDGLKVRNVTMRPSLGLRLCADCAQAEIPF